MYPIYFSLGRWVVQKKKCGVGMRPKRVMWGLFEENASYTYKAGDNTPQPSSPFDLYTIF